MSRKSEQNRDYWAGRLAVELGSALSALELGEVDLARAGLRKCMDEYLQEVSDKGLATYLEEMRRESQAMTPEPVTTPESIKFREAPVVKAPRFNIDEMVI